MGEKIDPEISAMTDIAKALAPLDDDSRARALHWAAEKFGINIAQKKGSFSSKGGKNQKEFEIEAGENEISDLVEYTDDNGTVLHFRDPKAKDKRDAVNRIVHIALFGHEMITGNKELPRSEITKTLEEWRLNDGNARSFIVKHPGFKRKDSGKNMVLYLDRPGKIEAKRFLEEILDNSLEGKWNPTTPKGKRKTKK